MSSSGSFAEPVRILACFPRRVQRGTRRRRTAWQTRVFYLDNVLRNPDPKGSPLAFPSVSILQYRDGLWCYEEDIYDVRASLRIKEQFKAGRVAR